jgi:hypothetical protein
VIVHYYCDADGDVIRMEMGEIFCRTLLMVVVANPQDPSARQRFVEKKYRVVDSTPEIVAAAWDPYPIDEAPAP